MATGVLFLGDARAASAARRLNELAGGAFPASAVEVGAATADALAGAAAVIGVNRAEQADEVKRRFPEQAGRVEFWEVAAGPFGALLLEREVTELMNRLRAGYTPRPSAAAPAKKGFTAKVGRETKGRKGKGVTLVWDLPLKEAELQELAVTLKNRCGTGGTVKDGRIEIQGDLRDRVAAELEKLGYGVKRVGG